MVKKFLGLQHFNYMKLEKEITDIIGKLDNNSCSDQEMILGIRNDEPILIIVNSLLRYCKAHTKRYECLIGDDSYSCRYVKKIIDGVDGLLSCNGGVAMEKGLSLDSKDNGKISKMLRLIKDQHGFDDF